MYNIFSLQNIALRIPIYEFICIENFQNCKTVSDDVNNQFNKSNWSLETQQQEQEEMKKVK